MSRVDWAARQLTSPYDAAREAPRWPTGMLWWQRIGKFMPEARDFWWAVRPDTSPAVLAAQVVAAVRDYGLPALRAHM